MMFGRQKSSLLVFLPHKYHECWHWKCQHSPGNRRFSGLDPGAEGVNKAGNRRFSGLDPGAEGVNKAGNRRFPGLDPGAEAANKARKSKILKPDPSAKQPKIKEITNGR